MNNTNRPSLATSLFVLTLLLSLFLAPALRAQILYEEDWEDAELGFPVGWNLGNVDDGNVDPGQACNGQALRMNLHSGNTNSTVSSPLINRGGTPGKLIISFDYRVADWNDNSQLSGTGLVGMNINGSGVWGQSISLTTGCERQTLTRTLAQVPLNSDFQITFVSTWTTGDWAYVADNITVRVIPDNCFDAYPLTQSTSPSADLSNPIDGSLEGATQTFTGCSGTANDDVWYSFTATTRAIDITVEAERDVVVVLYEGLCSGLNRLVCRDASLINESFRYDGVDPGETYLVRVHSYGSTPLTGSDAEFRIEVGTPDPVNDECVSAERISQSASDVCTSPTSATLENGSNSRPSCTGNATANDDVWFEFDATTDHFEVFVEAGDVVVELLTGTCGSLTSLACEDTFFANETINFDGATPGNTYYVRVYSFGNTPLTGAAAEFDICVYTVCPDPPTGLAVNSITATTAFVAGNYDIGLSRTHLVVAAGGSPTGAAVYQELSVLGSTTATGLSPNTAYDYYTIPDCGSNTPVGPVTFTTLVAGDECVDAFTLTQSAATSCGTNLTMGTVENATESQAGCTGTANDDVWYAFTATSTDFSVFLESGDLVVELFEGSCGSPSSLVCRDLFSVNETFNYADATIGQTYYLRVHSFNATPLTGADAEFGICVFTTPPAPANDECADAVLLPVNPTVTCSAAVSGTTGLAGSWYHFTASETEHFITLSNVDVLNGSGGPLASFEVFSGDCGALTQVQGSGQLAGTNPGPVTVSGLTPGQEYLIRVFLVIASNQIDFDICITTDCPELATGLSVTDITATTATLNFTENGELRDLVVVAEGDLPVFGDPSNVVFSGSTSGAVEATGLSSNTTYDFYVGQACPETFAGPITFTTRPSCGDVIYDTGGPSGNYGDNEDYTVTICPETADQSGGLRRVSITFDEFDAENGFDGITIYNGEDTNAPVVTSPGSGIDLWSWNRADNQGSGDLQGVTVFTTNVSGCITLQFTSDGSVTLPGFKATVNCDLTANVLSTILTTVPAGSGAVTADKGYLSTASGYMYYVKEGLGSLIALNLGDTQAKVPFSGVTMVAGSGATNLGLDGCMSPYTSALNWWVMNRTWDVAPAAAPVSPVGVRFFYTQEDFDAIVSSSGFAGLTHEELTFYKINGGDEEDLTAAGNACHDMVAPTNYQAFDPGAYTYSDLTDGSLGTTAHQAQFTVSSFSGGGGGASSEIVSALPVEFLSFQGEAGPKFNHLSWNTSREENTANHAVERSTDGQTWNTIANLPAAGNSDQPTTYEFVDEQPPSTALYRIRTIDADGSFTHSTIIELQRTQGADARIGKAYPNPAVDKVQLPFTTDEDGEELEIDLLDASGRRVNHQRTKLQNGRNDIEVSLHGLPSGLYWLSIRDGNGGRHLRRVIKE